MICSDIWHKYHECYYKIVLHVFIFVELFSFVGEQIGFEVLVQLVQILSQVDVFFAIFWFSEISFSS